MRDFKKPNLNASRYRPEVYSVMNKEFFESFKKKHPKYKNLDNKDIRTLFLNFFEIFMAIFLFEGFLVGTKKKKVRKDFEL